uniref:phasin family protein n=1 Tax=Methylobacterium nigriterrae TaxID=3127512 RepID=UPI00301372E6
SERLARQSKQNLEAVTRCGTVLTQAYQDASRSWVELSQKQWRRNLDGLNRLTQARSVQEFAAIQSELAREGLQHTVQDSRTIAQTLVRAVEEASKTFSSAGQQSPTAVR